MVWQLRRKKLKVCKNLVLSNFEGMHYLVLTPYLYLIIFFIFSYFFSVPDAITRLENLHTWVCNDIALGEIPPEIGR